jgi:putative peptidoglycan lipid II flippase
MHRSPADQAVVPTSTARGSATVAGWTMVSRVTGVGRVIVIGAVLGPTFLANTFVATNTIPNLAYLAIAGTVLSAVVVPAIVRTIANTGISSAAEVLGRLAGILLLVTGGASVLLVLASPLIARLLTFGIADAATRGRAAHLTEVMLLFVAPQVLFYMIATLGAAAQQARGRFALAAAAPAVENIGVVATVGVAGLLYASGIEMDNAPLGLPILLCLGSTISVAAHMALQLWGAARVGLPIHPHLRHWADPVTLAVAHRIRQLFVVAACPHVTYFGLLALAGSVPGGVLVLQIAYTVYSVPVALGARAVSTAVLPGLSAAADRGDRTMFNEKVREGIGYSFTAGLPPLFLLIAFASPIADVLANGRLRVGDLIASLAGCLVVLAVAQFAAGLLEVGLQGLFARLDVRGPRIGALLQLGATATVGLLALHGLAGPDRLIGLAAAVLARDVVGAAIVLALLHRMVRPEAIADRRWLGSAALSSTVMLPVVVGGWLFVELLHVNRIGQVLIVGSASTLALGAFALTLHAHVTRHREVVA